MIFRRLNNLRQFLFLDCLSIKNTSFFSAYHHRFHFDNFLVNGLMVKDLQLQFTNNITFRSMSTTEDDFSNNMIEVEQAFVNLVNNFKSSVEIAEFLPYLNTDVLLDDQIRGKRTKGHQEFTYYITKMNMWNSLKYTFFGYDVLNSGIIFKDHKIVLIRRTYSRRGGQYRMFSNISYLFKEISRRIMDPIGSRNKRRDNLLPNTKLYDEFMSISVNDNGLVDHILIRNVLQSDYDFVKKYQRRDEEVISSDNMR